jgi:hypothetical protein
VKLLALIASPFISLWILWSAAALWIDGPDLRLWAGVLAALPVITTIVTFARVGPWHLAIAASALPPSP